MALKRIKYVGPHDEVEIEWPLPGGRTVIKHGGHIDVPTRKAQEMARQTANWVIVEPETERRPHTQDAAAKKEDTPAEPAKKDGD